MNTTFDNFDNDEPADGNADARWQKPTFPGRDRFAGTNEITHGRDERGNFLPRAYTYMTGLPDTNGDDDIRFDALIEILATTRPLTAKFLAWKYYQIVRHAIEKADKTLAEEWAKLDSANTRAAAHNKALEQRIERLRARRETALEPHQRRLSAITAHIFAADTNAALAEADAGALYNPSAPTAVGDVLRLRPPSHQASAAHLNLADPETPLEGFFSPKWSTVLSLITGAGAGVSLGILSGGIEADTFLSDPASLVWAAFGIAATLWNKTALRPLGHGLGVAVARAEVAKGEERHLLRRETARWAWLTAMALVFTVAVIGAVDRAGILKFALLDDPGRAIGWDERTAFWAAGVFLSFGYTVAATLHGYFTGRSAVDRNRIIERQETDAIRQEEERRSVPKVKAAFAAVGTRLSLEPVRAKIERDLAEAAAPYDRQLAALEAAFLPINESLGEQARRHEDTLATAWGETRELLAALDRTVYGAEGGLPFFQALWLSLFGSGTGRKGHRSRSSG